MSQEQKEQCKRCVHGQTIDSGVCKYYNRNILTHLCCAFLGDPSVAEPQSEPAKPSAFDSQVGGDHYKKFGAYQPWEVLAKWMTAEELKGFMKGTVIAYLAREQDKNGLEDIKKAGHTIQLYLELCEKASQPETTREVEDFKWFFSEAMPSPWIYVNPKGVCPVAAGTTIWVLARDRRFYKVYCPEKLEWRVNGAPDDIVAYVLAVDVAKP